MSMFPHTVTVYNVHTEESPETGFQRVTVNHMTILRGVFLEASKAQNVRQSGMEGADAVNLYIPFSATAVDAVTGMERRYAGPVEFWKADDKSGIWTISPQGNCFFVKGEAVHPDWTVQRIEAAYDDVYNVTKVDVKDFGGDMSHFEVGGK